MDIVQIQEKFWGYSCKAQCYTVDIQKLYECIATLDSYDSIYKKFIHTLKTQKIQFMLMMDESMEIFAVKSRGDVERFKLGNKYSLVFDELINNYSRKVTLHKDGWDDYIAESTWIDYEVSGEELAIVQGVKEYKAKIFKKDKITKVAKEKVKDLIFKDTSFICYVILALLDEIRAIVYWEEERVIAIQFRTELMLPLNLNDKMFDMILTYIKQLERK